MTTPAIPKDVETTVGTLVGIATVLFIQGCYETIQGGLTAETKQRGAEMLTHLSMLRLDGCSVEELEHAAFLHAPDTIRRYCTAFDTEEINDLITSVLDIVNRTAKTEMH